MKRRRFRPLIHEIRFWIVFFFLIRLYGITLPPLETAHNWRQTTVTMVARNFLETESNIFYPRIDIAGEKTGITGMEFPLLNYLIFLVSKVFGYQHWYGRLINLIVSSIGTYFFYLLLRRKTGEQIAFFATTVLLVSVWFSYSRKIMPDTFSMGLMLAGLYFMVDYLDSFRKNVSLLPGTLLMLAGALSKLPAAYLMVLLLPYFVQKDISPHRKTVLGLAFLVVGIPTAFWYLYWSPNLTENYGLYHYFMGKSVLQGFRELLAEPVLTLSRFYETALHFLGFGAFLIGLYFLIRQRKWNALRLFLLASLGFFLLMLASGRNFYHHGYYVIPFVPVMAAVAGFGLAELRPKWAYLLLALICIEGLANQFHDFRLNPRFVFMGNLEAETAPYIPANGRVVINSGEYPTPMYFAHQKGWLARNDQLADPGFIDSLQTLGLTHALLLNNAYETGTVRLDKPVLLQTADYTLYEITPQ